MRPLNRFNVVQVCDANEVDLPAGRQVVVIQPAIKISTNYKNDLL
jgi:hypothetical protein